MSIMLTAVPSLDARLPVGPVHRLIVAVDIEGSTERNNPAKGELRRILYELLNRALEAAGIASRHLEPYTDRGDSVLILIKPHDDVPKTLVLGQLVPILAALLAEHNASVTRPELRMRLRAVVHAGEVHEDDQGFYGDDLDAAFRLLEAPKLKKALKEAVASPLILVVSEEIFHGISPAGLLRRRAIPAAGPGPRRPPAAPGLGTHPGLADPRPPPGEPSSEGPAAVRVPGHRLGERPRPGSAGGPRRGIRRQRARSASMRAGMTWCKSPMTA